MKAQISFVEYLVAFVIFLVFVGYFSLEILRFEPKYLNQIRGEIIRSETYQISEILVNDPGYPASWTLANVQRLGLSDEKRNLTNFLSLSKINAIGSNCAPGYEKVKEWLGSNYDFSITLIKKDPPEQILINCRPQVVTVREINTTLRRIVSFDSSYGELIIQMW